MKKNTVTQPALTLYHKYVMKCSVKQHVGALLTNIIMAVPSYNRDMILDPCYMSSQICCLPSCVCVCADCSINQQQKKDLEA